MSASALLYELEELGAVVWREGDELCIKAPPGKLDDRLRRAIRENKPSLLVELAAREIHRVDRTRPIPASFAQSRLWFLHQFDPQSVAYNIPSWTCLTERVDLTALDRAVREIVRRHDVLRTTYVAIDGEPHQVVHPDPDVRLRRVVVAAESDVEAVVRRENQTVFDLEHGPVLRATVVTVRDDLHWFGLTIHHVAIDGTSSMIVERELWTAYRAFAEDKPLDLPPIPIDYADFAFWQRGWLDGEVLEKQMSFWRTHLAGAPPALDLPTDHARPTIKKHLGAKVPVSFSESASDEIRAFARREGATPFMVFLAAFQCVLARWSGQDDIVIGTPTANRTRPELENIVGCFVNTLALRTRLDGAPSFREVVRRVKATALEAYAHQDVPFEKLVDDLKIPRDTSRTPLFQAAFVMQNFVETRGRHEVAEAKPASPAVKVDFEVAQFDLSLMLYEDAGRFGGSLSFDVALFERSTLTSMVRHLVTLLGAAMQRPDDVASSLPLLTEDERRLIVHDWNEKLARVPESTHVHAMFEAVVDRTPNATALIFDDLTVSYADLEARANRLAHRLRALGVGPDTIVAMRVPRSVEMVVAVLGIMKAGGAYLPLDPIYPADRAAFMLSDSGASILVTTRGHDAGLAARHCIFLEEIDDAPTERVTVALQPSNLAYVIYTSGSTGKPKGTLVTHHNVSRLFASTKVLYGFGAKDTWTLFHSIAFDFSVWELWGALAYGGRLVIVSHDVSRSPREFVDLVMRTGVTVLNQTPSAFRMFSEEVLSRGLETQLRYVIFGGEALDVPSLEPWFARFGDERPALVNMYGITETTVHVTHRRICVADTTQPASVIGTSLLDLDLYVLDEHGDPAPPRIRGELYVSGDGLARGYLGRPELTATRFVPDPFSRSPGARMYRTGDVARWQADASLEYLGRIDHQVKIRGFRIELGEIEAAISASPGVTGAMVLAREDTPGDKRLAAYVVAAGGALDVQSLKASLSKALPEYMVPSAFVVLDHFPLTTNGKIDRKALPKPDLASSAAEYVAPRTPREETLVELWKSLLGVSRVGVHDDFFALGGHSLLVMKLVAKLRDMFAQEIAVQTVFTSPTVAELARKLDSGELIIAPPISRMQVAPNTVLSYCQDVMVAFERDRPASGTWTAGLPLRLTGPLDRDALVAAVGLLVERQASLRLVVDFGPNGGPPTSCDASAIRVNVVDMRGRSEQEVEAFCDARAAEAFGAGPLIRFDLLTRDERDHTLMISFHQLVHDPTAPDLLIRELRELYLSLVENREPRLPPTVLRYVDYAVWQKKHFEEGAGKAAVERARERAASLVPLELPTDRPRRGHVTPPCVTIGYNADREASARFFEHCRAARVTPFMGYCVVTTLLLAQWSGQSEITFMAPVNLRQLVPSMQDVCGRFLNFTVVSVSIADDPTLAELFARAHAATLAAYSQSETPAPLAFKTPLIYDHPLLRVLLNAPEITEAGDGRAEPQAPSLRNDSMLPPRFVDPSHFAIEVDPVNVPSGARNEVAIVLKGNERRLFGAVRGATDLFDPATIEQKARDLHEIIRTLELGKRTSDFGIEPGRPRRRS